VWPGSGRRLRVEAAALRGKSVGFQVQGPWTSPWRTTGPETSPFRSAGFLIEIVLLMVILIGAPLLARANLRRGRGDLRGAFRLAVFLFVVHMALWLCRSHVIASLGTLGMFLLSLCTATFAAVLVWTAYLALEPYVRRNWPHVLIASTSALSGRWNDPVVGRDVLVGLLAGVAMRVIGQGSNAWYSQGVPHLSDTDWLLGVRGVLGVLLQQVPYAARNTLFFLFLLFLARLLLRNQWAAAVAFALVFTVLTSSGAWVELAVGFTIELIVAVVILRWGLLAGAVAYWIDNVMDLPLTSHTSAWYYSPALAALALFAAIAVSAFRTSLARYRA
jgi:hypothetical protein